MKQIFRLNTFETNSSTTHAVVICEGDEQNKLWEDGELYVDWSSNLYTKEELVKKFKQEKDLKSDDIDEDEFDNWICDNEYKNYYTWYEELEQDTTTYTSKSGDKIYIHCAYGYDG